MFKHNLKNSVSNICWYNRFKSDQNGNVAIIFALALIPVCFAVGLAVDYTRASDAQSTAQAATDAAALAAVIDTTSSGCPTAQKLINAQNAVRLNMSKKPWAHYNDSDVTLTLDAATGGCKVTLASGTIDTSISAAVGITKMNFAASSTAARGAGKTLEIAIALDNTGSMQDSMSGLKIVATNFVNTMFQKSAGPGQMRIGLVPFVATVNPGKAFINNASISDFNADAPDHGYLLNGAASHQAIGCGTVPVGSSGPNSGQGSGSDTTHSFLENIFGYSGAQFTRISHELLGITAAHALPLLSTTPPTDSSVLSWTAYTFDSTTAPLPGGANKADGTQFYIQEIGCLLRNPKVNLFDLFNRLPSPATGWKGCVMARPDPWDINAEIPFGHNASEPAAKYVPVFWPSDYSMDGTIHSATNIYKNNYISNEPSPVVFPDPTYYYAPSESGSAYSLFKYNGTTNGGSLTINEDPTTNAKGETWGPNKACPNEVTPLTSDLPTLLDQINNKLSFWDGGGTVTSEGLMWAWRVLSPNLPYGTNVTPTLGSNFYGGSVYNDPLYKKYIILMTDGVNAVEGNGRKDGSGNQIGEIKRDITAYGAIGYAWKFARSAPNPVVGGVGTQKFSEAEAILNDRFTKACINAKAQGITVYTIYFDHPLAVNPNPIADTAARAILSSCSGANNYFEAEDSGQLNLAFQKIANSIGISARLVK